MARKRVHPEIAPGDRFDRWTIVERGKTVLSTSKKGHTRALQYWVCRCDCGREKAVYEWSLLCGQSRSCKCLNVEVTSENNRTHGGSAGDRSPEYDIWRTMRQRCGNPNATAYEYYGGRGIRVCDRWEHGEGGLSGYECFVADMGPRPSLSHSVDRIDADRGYERGNCRWATSYEQASNRAKPVEVLLNGVQLSLPKAAEALGIRLKTARTLHNAGVPIEEWQDREAASV